MSDQYPEGPAPEYEPHRPAAEWPGDRAPVQPAPAQPPAYQPPVAPAAPPQRPRSSGGGRVFVAGLVGVLLGAALVTGLGLLALIPVVRQQSSTPPPVTTQTIITTASEDQKAIETAAAAALPSVVNIAVEVSGGNAVGSGIILTSDGYILTNNHVVASATRITVRLGTGDYDALVVGTDPTSDLAVIKVSKTGLTAARIGSSAKLLVGQTVLAVGSPFGLDKTVTAGIISALHRSNLIEGSSGVTAYTDLIQTDAAINPGNSGGALVDLTGAVVGVNTLIESPSGQLGASQSAGIGFAIPIDFAIQIADQLKAGKHITHPYLGVSALTVTPDFAAYYGLPVDSGALVQQVVPGSPAATAGLHAGDIIVRLDGEAVTSSGDMFAAVQRIGAGVATDIEFYRGGSKHTARITLVAR